MANTVYQFPNMPEQSPEQEPEFRQSPLAEAFSTADTFAYSPEKQPEAFRLFIDDAKHIDEYRDMALDAIDTRSKGIFNTFGRWREPTKIEDLIEKERHLTYSNASFWLGSKHDVGSDGREQAGEEVAHWFYHQYVKKEDGSTGEISIHYETRPTTMFKWITGTPYSVDLDEMGRFGQVVRHYKAKVAELHSPVDAELEALQDEEDEERIVLERTKTVAFSKPALDQMLAEYKANQAAGLAAAQQEVARLNERHSLEQQQAQQMRDSQARFDARRVMNDQNGQDENQRAA